MTQSNVCAVHDVPLGDAFACTRCRDTARGTLTHIADLMAAIDEKRARVRTNWAVSNIKTSKPAVKWRVTSGESQTFGARSGFAASSSVSFDPRVTRVADRAKNALFGSVRMLNAEGWDSDPGAAGYARWLSRNVEAIRMRPGATEEFAAFEAIKGDLFALFDNPPDTLYLGRCSSDTEFGPCAEALYVENVLPMREAVTCQHCQAEHVVAERRKELLTGVEDYLGTAKEISRLLRNLAGKDVSKQAISRYVQMGKLAQMGKRIEWDRSGRRVEAATYRIGAVRDLVAVLERDRSDRASKRASSARRTA